MVKKSITYTNPFTDEEVTEEHYFHISKADMVEMEMEEHNRQYTAKDGQDYTGMQAKLMKIIDAEDGKAIISELKEIIRRSYGEKVGERFVKSPEAWAEFSGSEAFSQLLFELCTDAEKAAEFMNGVIPKNLSAEAQQIAAQNVAAAEKAISNQEEPTANGDSPAIAAVEDVGERLGADVTPLRQDGPRLLTREEIQTMDPQELQAGIVNGSYKLS